MKTEPSLRPPSRPALARERASRNSRLSFVMLVGILAAAAFVLYRLAGPPHLPSHFPSWTETEVVLRGSEPPIGAMAYVFTSAAWLLLAWLVLSTALHSVVVIGERLSAGVWIAPLRALSDRVTAPVVRRVVESAFAAFLFANVVARGPVAFAAGPTSPASALVAQQATPSTSQPPESVDAGFINYTVQRGDTLWAIAQRFWGAGEEYPRIVEANAGRQMADGSSFTRQGVIRPGWMLRIPEPTAAVTEQGAELEYTVVSGDTLSGISAQLLNDPGRWPEVFDQNKGARDPEGRVLTTPDLIWPGLPLRLPVSAQHDAKPTAPQPPPTPKEPAVVPEQPPVESPTATIAPVETAQSIPTETEVDTRSASTTSRGLPITPWGSAALGVGVLATGAFAVGRRRLRRNLTERPTEDEDRLHIKDGFAEGLVSRVATMGSDGSQDPATILAAQALDLLAGEGVESPSVVSVLLGWNSARLNLSASAAGRSPGSDLCTSFAQQFGASGRVEITDDQEVQWVIEGFRRAALVPVSPGKAAPVLPLIPTGALATGVMVYTNWTEAKNVLVAGLPGGGSDTVVTSVLATLTARMSPAELQVWLVAGSRDLPAPMSRLPHVARASEASTSQALLQELNAELTRRIDAVERSDGFSPTPSRDNPRILLVVAEVADAGLDKGILDVLAADGPAHGIQVLAASSNADALDDGTIAQFQTRFVLQTISEPQSVRLIGKPDAVELAPGGELLFQLDGRRPIKMRAFRVPAEDLDDLLSQMHGAYGYSTVQTHAIEAAPEPLEEVVTEETNVAEDTQLTMEGVEREWSTEEPSSTASVGPPSDDGLQVHVEEVTAPRSEPHAVENLEPVRVEMEDPGVSSLAAVLGIETPTGKSTISVEPPAPATSSPRAAIALAEPGTGVSILVHAQCFGRLRVTSEGRELTPESAAGPRYKAWEILAYVACQPKGQVPKEKLMEALWPEKSAHDADDSVRVNLAALRDILAEQVPGISRDVIWTKNGVCRLDLSVVSTDVSRFCELCERLPGMSINEAAQAFEELGDLYRGDLVTEPLYDWVDGHMEGASLRQEYRETFRRTTFGLARRFQQTGQPALAIPLYERLLQSEPALEDVVRELYRCHHQLGNAGAIVRIDKDLRRVLKQTYGEHADRSLLNPEPQTDQLFQQLLADLRSAGTQHGQAVA